jgi:MFS family permease
MLFLGVPFFNRVWIELWHVAPPRDSELATASLLTGMVGAPVKGAFFVMAVWGIRSTNPSTRTALFVSMSLVPPFNVAMPFRYQGFVPGPVLVGSILSAILWSSFFLFKEPYRQPEQKINEGPGQLISSSWEIFQYILFAITSIAITVLAFLFLFFPKTALTLSFPCMPDLLNSSQADLSGMIYHSMASGTHLLALSIGSWIATVNCRRNPSLRQVMTITIAVFIALFFIFPIRQMIAAFGMNCITPFILYAFALLLAGWLIYAFSDKVKFKTASFNTN